MKECEVTHLGAVWSWVLRRGVRVCDCVCLLSGLRLLQLLPNGGEMKRLLDQWHTIEIVPPKVFLLHPWSTTRLALRQESGKGGRRRVTALERGRTAWLPDEGRPQWWPWPWACTPRGQTRTLCQVAGPSGSFSSPAARRKEEKKKKVWPSTKRTSSSSDRAHSPLTKPQSAPSNSLHPEVQPKGPRPRELQLKFEKWFQISKKSLWKTVNIQKSLWKPRYLLHLHVHVQVSVEWTSAVPSQSPLLFLPQLKWSLSPGLWLHWPGHSQLKTMLALELSP